MVSGHLDCLSSFRFTKLVSELNERGGGRGRFHMYDLIN